ncbi:MAG: alkaline phosphatase D family protein [Blastocatellia bacterium]
MKRRDFLLASAAHLATGMAATENETPHNAMGERLGEVTHNSAIVHTRLTLRALRNETGLSFPPMKNSQEAQFLPSAQRVDELEGACPGAAGRARLLLATNATLRNARVTAWAWITADTDFTHQFPLADLRPRTKYYYAIEMSAATGAVRRGATGTFTTAPAPNEWRPVMFCVATCQQYQRRDDPGGFQNYKSIQKLAPDFMAMVGDNVYYDSESPVANSIELARYHWQRMQSLPNTIAAFHSFGCYWTKDDHDILSDDCWPGMTPDKMKPLTFADGQRIFRQQIPMGEKYYRRFRRGRGLEIWLTESRDFRSPNNIPDNAQKTIWGAEQKRWLKETLLASDATWKILISPNPLVGPDRATKGDNHSNAAFATEGREFRQWVQANGLRNLIVICGDRHWQYHSVDPETGLNEFSVGPMSDSHAGGTPGENKKYHRFHRVKGGFLSVSLTGSSTASRLFLRHHDVQGNVVYENPMNA